MRWEKILSSESGLRVVQAFSANAVVTQTPMASVRIERRRGKVMALLDGIQSCHLRKINEVLIPPKAKLLLITMSVWSSRPPWVM